MPSSSEDDEDDDDEEQSRPSSSSDDVDRGSRSHAGAATPRTHSPTALATWHPARPAVVRAAATALRCGRGARPATRAATAGPATARPATAAAQAEALAAGPTTAPARPPVAAAAAAIRAVTSQAPTARPPATKAAPGTGGCDLAARMAVCATHRMAAPAAGAPAQAGGRVRQRGGAFDGGRRRPPRRRPAHSMARPSSPEDAPSTTWPAQGVRARARPSQNCGERERGRERVGGRG